MMVSKLLAALPLIVGYFTGQGSIFLINTLLASQSEFERIWDIAVCFAILAVANGVVDWGTTTTAPRDAAGSKETLFIANSNILRLGLSVPVSICLIAVSTFVTHPFIRAFMQVVPFSIFVNSINLTGILDGPGRPVIQKFLQGLPFIAASVAILASTSLPSYDAGITAGIGLLIGTFINIAFQYFSTKKRLFNQDGFATGKQLRIRFSVGWRILVSFIASQGCALAISVLAGITFGSSSGGVLIYARTLIVASVQIAILIRRIEIHQNEQWDENFGVKAIFRKYAITSMLSIIFPAFASIVFFAIVLFDFILPLGIYRVALVAYVVTVPLAIVTTVLNGELILRKAGNNIWIFDICANAVCVAVFIYLSKSLGYSSFFLADMLFFTIKLIFLIARR